MNQTNVKCRQLKKSVPVVLILCMLATSAGAQDQIPDAFKTVTGKVVNRVTDMSPIGDGEVKNAVTNSPQFQAAVKAKTIHDQGATDTSLGSAQSKNKWRYVKGGHPRLMHHSPHKLHGR
jgi:hypothetical protein